MAELEEKLNAILGNPEAMGQIMNIAKALGGGGSSAPASSPTGPITDAEFVPVEGGESSAEPAANPLAALGNLDPRLVQAAMRLFSEYSSTDDRKTALLAALRPFLKESRISKIDRAVEIAKLSRVIRVAFELFRGGGTNGDV